METPGIIERGASEVRLKALQECLEIADYHAGVFGSLEYERCAKDIRAAILELMKAVLSEAREESK